MPEILDAYGKPVELPKPVEVKPEEPIPEPHKFGHFVVPKDTHIKGFDRLGETGNR